MMFRKFFMIFMALASNSFAFQLYFGRHDRQVPSQECSPEVVAAPERNG